MFIDLIISDAFGYIMHDSFRLCIHATYTTTCYTNYLNLNNILKQFSYKILYPMPI